PTPWRADVQDILCQEELVEDHLRPWVKDIERETDLLGAHAVWWAVENMVALKDLSTRRHLRVHYESAIVEPLSIARSIIKWLQESVPSTNQLMTLIEQNSRMSHHNVQYQSSQERLARWQAKLAKDDQDRILRWAHHLGIEYYSTRAIPQLSNEDLSGGV